MATHADVSQATQAMTVRWTSMSVQTQLFVTLEHAWYIHLPTPSYRPASTNQSPSLFPLAESSWIVQL